MKCEYFRTANGVCDFINKNPNIEIVQIINDQKNDFVLFYKEKIQNV